MPTVVVLRSAWVPVLHGLLETPPFLREAPCAEMFRRIRNGCSGSCLLLQRGVTPVLTSTRRLVLTRRVETSHHCAKCGCMITNGISTECTRHMNKTTAAASVAYPSEHLG